MGASNHGGKATVHALQLCMYGYGPGWECDHGTADKASFLQLIGHCHATVVFVFLSLILVFTHTHICILLFQYLVQPCPTVFHLDVLSGELALRCACGEWLLFFAGDFLRWLNFFDRILDQDMSMLRHGRDVHLTWVKSFTETLRSGFLRFCSTRAKSKEDFDSY